MEKIEFKVSDLYVANPILTEYTSLSVINLLFVGLATFTEVYHERIHSHRL